MLVAPRVVRSRRRSDTHALRPCPSLPRRRRPRRHQHLGQRIPARSTQSTADGEYVDRALLHRNLGKPWALDDDRWVVELRQRASRRDERGWRRSSLARRSAAVGGRIGNPAALSGDARSGPPCSSFRAAAASSCASYLGLVRPGCGSRRLEHHGAGARCGRSRWGGGPSRWRLRARHRWTISTHHRERSTPTSRQRRDAERRPAVHPRGAGASDLVSKRGIGVVPVVLHTGVASLRRATSCRTRSASGCRPQTAAARVNATRRGRGSA